MVLKKSQYPNFHVSGLGEVPISLDSRGFTVLRLCYASQNNKAFH